MPQGGDIMNFIYVMLTIYFPVFIIAIKEVTTLITVVSCLLKAIEAFLKTVYELVSTFKNLKRKYINKKHKKKLPHNSWRKRR